MPRVLLTGGAGYIGTHVACVLAAAGRRSASYDNYCNSSPKSLERVERIAPGMVQAYEGDIRDLGRLREVLRDGDFDSVIHFAGLKAVGESVAQPQRYRENNVGGTATLLEALQESRVREFVFSSSATIYGAAARMPIDESCPPAPTNPYGENKLEIERMLADLVRRDPSWRVALLRYFNPVGAHESGLIGEDPRGTPNNLMPYVCQAAVGKLPELRIFGDDYPTNDGTGVRDYIHVMDLAEGHVAALEALDRSPAGAVLTVNLGTGRGYSVMELVEAFERVNGVKVPRRVVGRRPGDIAVCYADASLARKVLGWQARRGIEEMCRDAWRWQSMNPNGFE
ncbi:MAG TPA: UDP-glucose 4-epimerase GalE [Usitatibacter sp.]|nr:UDP-glucose 4-epimerase GalE [Usitatibacter sp.]